MSGKTEERLKSDAVFFWDSLIKREGEDLYDYQKAYLRCNAETIVVWKGRDVGLSFASAIKAVH